MTHITATPQSPGIGAGTLVTLVLVGALGFALGQSWPLGEFASDPQLTQPIEDWHGNVRRSNWSE